MKRGLAKSCDEAHRLILAGKVILKNVSTPKPGFLVSPEVNLQVKQSECFVSRGGLKLAAALDAFSISVKGKICADIGASTGGFTDCLIQSGARRVYAVDVGISQMHEKIKKHPDVVLLENTNAKYLRPDMFFEPPTFAAVDVSFISVLKILLPLAGAVSGGDLVVLKKPQFEAERSEISKGKGIIRDEAVHRRILSGVLDKMPGLGWQPVNLMASPVQGASGNVEFLCHASLISEINITGQPRIDVDAVLSEASKQP